MTLTPLLNNPGVLPFALGPAKIQKSEHVFIHYFDLDKIKSSITSLGLHIVAFNDYIKQADPKYFRNFLVSREILLDNIELIKAKYNSLSISEINVRNKRGLINGAGSIIKFITGNLDQEDAIKYTKAISALQKNQESLQSAFSKSITLNKQLLSSVNSMLSTIATNQYRIHTQINEVIREINMTNYGLSDFIKMTSLYNLLQVNCFKILDSLTLLENSISFSKLHVTHHSVLTVDNIRYISETLTTLYQPDEILVNTHTNLRDYYELLKSGSYYVDNMVVFILKFPIMYKNTYSYYHLYPTPTHNNTIIVPPNPYLAMDAERYQYMDQQCPKFKDNYYCQESAFLFSNSNHEDCLHHLILKQDISTNCLYTSFTTTSEIWQKIDDAHYILVCPNHTKIQLSCEGEHFDSIQGTYLLYIPEGCSATTEMNAMKNYMNKIQGRPMKLLSFELTNVSIKNPVNPLKLENIQLDKLYELETLVEKETITFPETTATTTFSYWTLPLYFVIVIIGCLILYRKYKKRSQEGVTAVPTDDVELQQQSSSNVQSIFHKNMKKGLPSDKGGVMSTIP